MACAPNRYVWQQLGWVALSALLALGAGLLKRSGLDSGPVRWIVSLLPVLPMVGYFLSITKWIRSLDEMQRLIQLEAGLIQFVITALAVMVYGVLADSGAVPNTPVSHAWPWIWMLLFLSWSIGQWIVSRRYR